MNAGTPPSALAAQVVERARALGVHVITAESVTGGLVCAALTDIPGASEVVAGGVVAYSAEMKVRLLGVDPDGIAAHGAVSEWTAAAMATGALSRSDATWAVATTGVAGPGPADGVPQGNVVIAVSSVAGTTVARVHLPGHRANVRHAAVAAALTQLLQALD